MCLNIYGQDIYIGKIIGKGNPCMAIPCLPCAVLWLETTSNDYVLSYNSHWICDDEITVDDSEYFVDDEVEITGTIITKQDINSNEYIELEIEAIKKSTPSNIEILPSDNNKVYFDATNQIIIIDETLQNQSLALELIDIQGKVILRKTGLGNKSSISVANLLNGIYLYRLTRDGMVICTGKIIKNN